MRYIIGIEEEAALREGVSALRFRVAVRAGTIHRHSFVADRAASEFADAFLVRRHPRTFRAFRAFGPFGARAFYAAKASQPELCQGQHMKDIAEKTGVPCLRSAFCGGALNESLLTRPSFVCVVVAPSSLRVRSRRQISTIQYCSSELKAERLQCRDDVT